MFNCFNNCDKTFKNIFNCFNKPDRFFLRVLLVKQCVFRMEESLPKAFILHNKLAQRGIDRYVIALALALMQLRFKTSIMSTYVKHCVDFTDYYVKMDVLTCGEWIPFTIFGFFENVLSFFKDIYLACKLVFLVKKQTPLKAKPRIIFHDLNVVAALILKVFLKGEIVYIQDFLTSKMKSLCYDRRLFIDDLLVPPSLLEKLTIKLSTAFIVPSFTQAKFIEYSWPHRRPAVLHLPINMSLFRVFKAMHIQKLVPDMLTNTKMFLCIGNYNRNNNFELVVDSFFSFINLLKTTESEFFPESFKLVIAGQCSSPEEDDYYQKVYKHLCNRWGRLHCVTLLNTLSVIHQKTLLESATLSIHPGDKQVSTDFLMKSMYMEVPIIATDAGEAAKILTHEITAMVVEPTPENLAKVYLQLCNDEHLTRHITKRAKRVYDTKYSFKAFVKNTEKFLHSQVRKR